MARVATADNYHVAVTTDDPAVIADSLHAGVDLHGSFPRYRWRRTPGGCRGRSLQDTHVANRASYHLLIAVDDPAAGQVVGAQLNDHTILGEDTDVVLTHLARDVGENFVSVGQLHAKHRIGECLDNRTFDFDDTVFFGHSLTVVQK